jgi:SAM-dependent methyltransferase
MLDLGCGTGAGAQAIAARHGWTWFGVDIDESKIDEGITAGRPVARASIFDAPGVPLAKVVRLDNVLEHLATTDDVIGALRKAAELASLAIWVRHPSFDAEDDTRPHGVRPYWTNWTGHRSPLRITQLIDAARHAFGDVPFQCHPCKAMWSTDEPALLPLSAPNNQHEYDAAVHGAKPRSGFERPVYAAYDLVWQLHPDLQPSLRYADRIGTDRRPEFGWVREGGDRLEVLESELAALRQRRSLRFANRVGRVLRRLKRPEEGSVPGPR